MNSQEKDCVRELLSGLREGDLIDLSKTITKGNFTTPTNKQEAVDLILRYETDIRSLLNRKKISTNLLRHYLHFKNVQFCIEDTKHSLCDIVINFWRSSSALGRCITSGEDVKSIPNTPPDLLQIEQPIPDQSPTCVVSSTSLVSTGLSESDVSLLGVQFITWFYSQIRGPDLQMTPVDSIHFFSDASSRVLIRPQDVREGTGGESCASVLTEALRDVGNAFLLANEASIRSEVSTCGAIKVMACGTLHAHPSLMLGSFEQAFLLVRDPSATDNWKIKYTEIRMSVEQSKDDSAQSELEHTQSQAIQF